jgi:hypothetical protein
MKNKYQTMNAAKLVFVVIALLTNGCLPVTKISDSAKPSIAVSTEEAEPSFDERITFIKQRMSENKLDPNTLIIAPSLYDVIARFQDGTFKVEELAGYSFFLKNSVGKQSIPELGTAFVCRLTNVFGDAKNDAGHPVEFEGYYSNKWLPITVSVIWQSHTPLVGQLLNSDFLFLYKGENYDTESGLQRSKIIFVRPDWVGRNGKTSKNR